MITRLEQELTHLNASQKANRAAQLLKGFFGGADKVIAVVEEDR